eukprot:m.108285 g.108285  ORF g.108285 m.108285 type:complete len:104 (-) comp9251_c0_seq1:426-737(-)
MLHMDVSQIMLHTLNNDKGSGSTRKLLQLETLLVQLLKRALGLEESKAFIVVGKHGFPKGSIDLDMNEHSIGMAHLSKDTAIIAKSLISRGKRQASQEQTIIN